MTRTDVKPIPRPEPRRAKSSTEEGMPPPPPRGPHQSKKSYISQKPVIMPKPTLTPQPAASPSGANLIDFTTPNDVIKTAVMNARYDFIDDFTPKTTSNYTVVSPARGTFLPAAAASGYFPQQTVLPCNSWIQNNYPQISLAVSKSRSCQNLVLSTDKSNVIVPPLPPKKSYSTLPVPPVPPVLQPSSSVKSSPVHQVKLKHSSSCSDSLIDLNDAFESGTKVSILEVFDPLLELEEDSPDSKEESSYYSENDPFEYMSAKAESSTTTNQSVEETFSPQSMSTPNKRPAKKHTRYPSIGNGIPDNSTVERRKRKKQEYDDVVKGKDEHMMKLSKSKEIRKKEKNTAIDHETVAFTKIVNELRSEFSCDDVETNPGIVLSPTAQLASSYPESTSVRVIVEVNSGTKSFTCNVGSTVEHLIAEVVFDAPNQSTNDFILQIIGRKEYLRNNAKLEDYEYVHQCFKYDRDLEFALVPISSLHRYLRRTEEDDECDTNIKVEELNTADRCRTLSYDDLEILLSKMWSLNSCDCVLYYFNFFFSSRT